MISKKLQSLDLHQPISKKSFSINRSFFLKYVRTILETKYIPFYFALSKIEVAKVFQVFSNAQNFYLLKIHLNWFEISNRVLKSENLISIWKSIILSENLFQTWLLRSATMCVYSSLSHDKDEYMNMALLCRVYVWNKFSDSIIFFSDLNKIFKFQNSIWDFK